MAIHPESKGKISCVFLGAGEGNRFGSQKLLHKIDGKPLIYYGLKSCVGSSLEYILVILGDSADMLKEEIYKYFPGEKKIGIVVNKNFKQGMMSSFKLGLKNCGDSSDGIMMYLGDMPFVRPETINKLLSLRKKERFVIPKIENVLKHPRIIPSCSFSDFFNLKDNEKGEKILKKFSRNIDEVIFQNRDEFSDIDTLQNIL
ncbi:MAG: nucleotidyltransferase family protein [Acidobacteriota bacterium]